MHSVFLGIFLIAFSSLTLEVTLSRFLSVVTWYHLSFFAISTAMLGMTAGATKVYLNPEKFFKENLYESIGKACFAYSLSIPVTLLVLCFTPLTLEVSVWNLAAFFIATLACSLPFYFSGIAVTAVLTKSEMPIGHVYACDLVGASLGCLFVLIGLKWVGAPNLILTCSVLGFLSGYVFLYSNPESSYR